MLHTTAQIWLGRFDQRRNVIWHLTLPCITRGQRVQYPRSGFAVHAPGFMPGVLTTLSRDMVTIPRVELRGFALAT